MVKWMDGMKFWMARYWIEGWMDGWVEGWLFVVESLVYQRTDRLVLGKFGLIDE